MMRLTMRRAALLPAAFALSVALAADEAAAQTYPAKPIRLIAPYPPGGSSDILARILGEKLTAPQLIVVNPALQVKSMEDLVALGKSKPGSINYGSSGIGTLPHLGGEMFATMTGVKITHVPYKGSPPALLDLMAGQVQVVFADMPVALPHVKAGKLRAIAVAGAKPFPLTPGMPTAIEAGLPGLVLDNC